MSILEGRGFRCFKDDFETRDFKEWNKHCGKKEGNTTHITESGTAPCLACARSVDFEEMPYTPYAANGTKTYAVYCEECSPVTTAKTRKLVGRDGGGVTPK